MNIEPVFVFGYSRSGTKFMLNLIEQASPEIAHLGELHFFGRLALTGKEEISDSEEASQIAKKLAEQYAKRKNCPYSSKDQIEELVLPKIESDDSDLSDRKDVLALFLDIIAEDLDVNFLCDGTPRNAYYISEILEIFPNAKLIYMVRDPRDCVASQKAKPKQAFQEGNKKEGLRLLFNYNPLLMGKFWSSSISQMKENISNDNLLAIRYEELLSEPIRVLTELETFLKVSPGSLCGQASKIKNNNAGKFRKQLSPSEITVAEIAVGDDLEEFGYNSSAEKSFLAKQAHKTYWLARLAVATPLVYLLNLGRFMNAGHELKKRIFQAKT